MEINEKQTALIVDNLMWALDEAHKWNDECKTEEEEASSTARMLSIAASLDILIKE